MSRTLGRSLGLNLPRVVLPEVLDGLAADDRTALRSRRDLQRMHRAMGTRGTLMRALRALPLTHTRSASPTLLRVLELGAGDGSLMLRVARSLQGQWPAVALTLLDRLPLLTAATVAEYALAGWTVTAEVGDAIDWAARANAERFAPPQSRPSWDVIVANLFLHHFRTAELAALLAAVAGSSVHFVACEPRRAWLAWAGSHLVGALGANAVTREDAVLSVHAGFRDQELRVLWPATSDWILSEAAVGLFSHCFVASRATGSGLGAR